MRDYNPKEGIDNDQSEGLVFKQEETAVVEDWPMIRRDAAYSGSDGSSLQPPLEKKWEFKARGNIESTPSLAHGMVFFGCMDKHVYALDADTGNKRWTFKTDKGITTTPVVANGYVYVAGNDKTVYAIDALTGEEHWRFSLRKEIYPLAVGHGLVFFGCKDKQIYALDAQTGQAEWVQECGDKEYSAPTIAANRVLIVGKNLYSIDAKSGEYFWYIEDCATDLSPIVLWGGVIIVRDSDTRKIGGFNLIGGTDLGSWFSQMLRSLTMTDGLIYASFVLPPGLIAYSQVDQRFDIQWAANIEEALPANCYLSAPAIGGDFAFVTVLGGNQLFGVNTSRFMKRWVFTLNENITSPPVITNGLLFVASEKGKIHAFRGSKAPQASAVLEYSDFQVLKEPIFRSMLHQDNVVWPSHCSLCCGPAEETTKIEWDKLYFSTRERMTIPGVPYCKTCHEAVGKAFRAERPGVEVVSFNPPVLGFRNQEYWAMFMETNKLR
ncbi:MAG: outer membrane protein assembly factor BamB family protein [Candidatus Thorarchaeota archaeon]